MWKDFKWVEKRFGTKFANILKGVKDIAEEGGQEISNHFITSETGEVTFKDLDDNNHVLVTTEALQDENSPVKELFDESVASLLAKNGLIEVKWQELKDKRDNGQLIPGGLYRIIDYNCTTTQENTRSAGHQFDIVLLALSANKLAEEGWAMMHDNVYDVTFSDGVTKKCYIYKFIEDEAILYNLVTVDTFLGISYIPEVDIDIHESNKTATYVAQSSFIDEENLTYNYFQNSNLSAWKVWYSLDNDTARFAWADDNTPQIYDADDELWFVRDSEHDTNNKFAWYNIEDNAYAYTDNIEPKVGEQTYTLEDDEFVPYFLVSSLKGFGRGVIYRLIDEWNNDVGYDFKNIQYIRPMTDGQYDPEGEDTFVYTSSSLDDNENIIDNSLFKTDAPIIIYPLSTLDGDLPNNVFFDAYDVICKNSTDITCLSTNGTIESSVNCVLNMVPPVYLLSCFNLEVTDDSAPFIYIANKKVLTEE